MKNKTIILIVVMIIFLCLGYYLMPTILAGLDPKVYKVITLLSIVALCIILFKPFKK